jgi:hypothetical protein
MKGDDDKKVKKIFDQPVTVFTNAALFPFSRVPDVRRAYLQPTE